MSKKIMWFDVETTGLDPKENDIVQLAGKLFIDGEVVSTINKRIQPVNWDNISDEALKVTGLTIEDLKTYDEPKTLRYELLDMWRPHIQQYERDRDRLIYFGGYNMAAFDKGFLDEYFKKMGDDKLVFRTNFRVIDVIMDVYKLNFLGVLKLKNYKLETVCRHFEIPIDAHDAMSDIDATIKLYEVLQPILKEHL